MKAKLSTLDAAFVAVLTVVTLNVSGGEPAEKVQQTTTMTLGRAIALADSGKNLIHILDSKGSVVWQYPAHRPRDVWVLPNGNTIICNWAGHGYVGKQPQLVEVTADKKVVGALFDYNHFGTISGFFVLDPNHP